MPVTEAPHRRINAMPAELRRWLWPKRQLPHGLLGPGLLIHAADARCQKHLRIWWQAPRRLPRVIWLLAEALLWLRWVLFHAWRQAWLQSGRPSAGLAPAGRERLQLLAHFLGQALWWGLPPNNVVRYGRRLPWRTALDYVFDHELPAWHRACAATRGAEQARTRLQDKYGISVYWQSLGLPVVPSMPPVPQYRDGPLAKLLSGAGPWFCKTRHGHAGRGAFSVQRSEHGLHGQWLDGPVLPDQPTIESAWTSLLELDDGLIQRHLQNHPDLAPLATSDALITIRLITWQRTGQPQRPAIAYLEVPVSASDGSGQTRYLVLPLDAATGSLLPLSPEKHSTLASDDGCRALLDRIPRALVLPDWPQILAASAVAHTDLAELPAIAWDWASTPDGPRLLEGNHGWGVSIPQWLHGGLLADLD